MDSTTLLYALSTLAQCAAALAALIGFLGLWRLDRLQGERDRIWQRFYMAVEPGLTPTDREALRRDGEGYYVGKAREMEAQYPVLASMRVRWDTIPREQQRLMCVLQRFLRRTLVILALAIMGLVVANVLNAWIVTALIARLLIIIAGFHLWRDTASVVREATSTTRSSSLPTPSLRGSALSRHRLLRVLRREDP